MNINPVRLLIAFLLMTVLLAAPQPARADPGVLYAAPAAQPNSSSGSWRYVRPIVINNTANPQTLTDYQVLIQFDTQTLVAQGKMKPDGSDIRFTADFQTFLNYWIEKGIQNEFGIGEPDTKVWVKVPLIPGGGATTIYLLYGNPLASPMSNIQATFLFGDDFDDNSLDLSRWQVRLVNQGQLREQNQRLEHWSPMWTESDSIAISTQSFTGPVVLETRFCKGGYVYRWVGLWEDENHRNAADMWIWDWGPILFQVIQDGVQNQRMVQDGFWSRQYNPQYYVQIIRRPDGSFVVNGSVPAFEPGGPKNWSATFTQTLPLDLPLRVFLVDHTWQGAWWLWDRYEDDTRVRKYTEPEPTATVSSQENTILYAAPTAQGNGNCSSWANACTLQTALAQAVSGDEIWVKAGAHYPGAAGNRGATFTLKNGVALYGGFAGTETIRGQRNWQANRTILSGDIDQNDNHGGDYINENASQIVGNNAYHVVTGSGTNNTAVLDGFIITAGQAKGTYPHSRGGGMYNYSGSPTLTHIAFSGNAANYGGGVFNWTSDPALTNVTFSGNAASYGGGMYNESSSPALTNVTFGGNSAVYGGGMHNAYYSDPSLGNVVMWGNTATFGASIYNNNSTSIVSYSDIQGCGDSGSGWNVTCGTDGGGNIDADPRFMDAANGNLRLFSISPAVDAGNNAAVPAGIVTDLGGNPRFVDIPAVPDTGNGTPPIVDMGAYEAQDGTPPTVLSITRADPNPTNATSVRFTVAFSEAVLNVDAGDFSLTTTGGISGAGVTGVSGSGATYTVTVDTGTGDGTLRLDVPDTASVTDLAGNPLDGLPYTDGEAYEVHKDSGALSQQYTSVALQDGWVLEGKETIGMGAKTDANGKLLLVGDDARDRQYRAVLSFDTSGLSAGAVITRVTLRLKLQGVGGTNPFDTHGSLLVDVRQGYFASRVSLQPQDFQARADGMAVGAISEAPVDGWYVKVWEDDVFDYINRDGLTQFRLRFAQDDNDDFGADYLRFYSGNAGSDFRPQLIIEYYLP